MASLISKNIASFDNIMVPFSIKGHFFEDDFFQHSRHNFISAVQQAMSRVHQTSQDLRFGIDHDFYDSFFDVHNNTLIDSYRQLRLKDCSEESQASTVTRTGNSHQIVIDVKGFKEENLSVKIIKEDQILIEGEQKEEAEGSSRVRKFSKTFRFPGLKSEEVTAVLSSDGVFTVNVPVKIQRAISGVSIPVKISGSITTNESAETQLNESKKVEAEENLKSQSVQSESQNIQTQSQNVQLQSQKVQSQSQSVESQSQNLQSHPSIVEKFIPITLKGSFLQDNFSHGFRNNFLTAIQDIVKKSNKIPTSSSTEDMFSCYRQLREKSPKEENQASSVIEDDHTYKVVLDIHEFIEGDIKINVLEHKQLKVEGSIKVNEPFNKQMSFQRSFHLQQMGKTEDISAVMSEDGILTIVVPKQKSMKSITNESKSSESRKTSTTEEIQKQEKSSISNQAQQFAYPESFDKKSDLKKTVDRCMSKRDINIKPMSSFFKNLDLEKDHCDFLKSVKNVLNQWGVKMCEDDEWQSYRNLRRQNSCEENQAVTFKEEAQEHKIIIDVEGFTNDNIKINLIGEDQITVEGSSNKTEGSSSSSHSFKRHFYLPRNILVDEVKSSLSSEGILTIVIPKRVKECKAINIAVEQDAIKSTEKTNSVNSQHKESIKTNEKIIEIKQEDDSTLNKSTQEDKMPVIEKATLQTVDENSSASLRAEENKEKEIKIVQSAAQESLSEVKTSSASSVQTAQESLSDIKTSSTDSSKSVQEALSELEISSGTSAQSAQEALSEIKTSSGSSARSDNIFSLTNLNDSQNRMMISKKNNFLEDSFFNSVKSAYEDRVKDILSFSGTNLISEDWMNKYKDLRLSDVKEENQAVVITEDEHNHKVVLDVDAFTSGNVSVRAISSNELIVEGKTEQEKDGSKSKRSFKRCFYLPGVIDMKNVTSAISSDGVLTIIAPKKQSAMQYIDEAGKVTQLQVAPSGNGGQGSSWQQEHEQTTSGDGYSSKVMTKSFQSYYSSSS